MDMDDTSSVTIPYPYIIILSRKVPEMLNEINKFFIQVIDSLYRLSQLGLINVL